MTILTRTIEITMTMIVAEHIPKITIFRRIGTRVFQSIPTGMERTRFGLELLSALEIIELLTETIGQDVERKIYEKH